MLLSRVGSKVLPSLRKMKVINHTQIQVRSFSKSWVPVNEEKLQQVTMQSLIHEVSEQQKELASKTVPWFLKNMPAAYFRQVPEHMRSQHIKAVTALRDLKQSDLSLKIETKLEDSLEITFINTEDRPGLLHSQIKNLVVPKGYELAKVNVFSSFDGQLALNIFSLQKVQPTHVSVQSYKTEGLNQYIEEIKRGEHSHDVNAPVYSEIFEPKAIQEYIQRLSPSYVETTEPRRFLNQRILYEQVRGTDSTSIHIEPYFGTEVNPEMSWVTICAANVLPEVLLRLSSGIISAYHLDISRTRLDTVACPESSTSDLPGYVTMLRMLVNPVDGAKSLNDDPQFSSSLSRALKRAKWYDNSTTQLGLVDHPTLGLDKAEVITALSAMLHGPLYKKDKNAFPSIKSILQTLSGNQQYINIAGSIATLFLNRFNPANPLSESDYKKAYDEINGKIQVIQLDNTKLLLDKMLETVNSTLRTNFYNEDRYALSLRVEPKLMMNGEAKEKAVPFGVFFAHGRNFNAFHCRFRDIARGGLRLVTPPNSDSYALESSRVFDEVYNLSYAQQLKNKDIPEGGAKGVVLINTAELDASTRFFAMRKAVKAFSDSLLDLIVKDSVKNLVDFYKKDELIYLGPDEQIIPSDIEYIVDRAAQRGYPIPAAFMSSKKENGINHKQYGVTSEGVVVYLDVALKNALKIDPKTTPFTVKITGGPDGDVAGNLIRILYRDYGSNAKVVAVADGSGVAEDPNGLDAEELLHLVHESFPISKFNREKLSPQGALFEATNDEGALRRNTMHFRIKSDVFIPAGGRPNSINSDNWHQFIHDGVPTSPLIVEGANIFTTPDARKKLFEHGKVTIVKDSSANKCGVITSSCEVAASMLLSKAEFMAIKPELVEDVLVRLRDLAKSEGELLFREFQNYPGALPHFSERISLAIEAVKDAVAEELLKYEPNDPLFQELLPLIRESLPKKLADVAGDRIPTHFPVQYQRNAIASSLASKLVYQEGIHLVETQPKDRLAQRAISYHRAENEINKLIADLNSENFPHKEKIIDILKRGGARTELSIF